MKGKNILEAFGYIGDDLIENAETRQFPEDEGQEIHTGEAVSQEGTKHHKIRKPFLIAAIIALMILLMGSAVVALSLDSLRIGEESYTTKTRYSDDGTKILPTEKVLGTFSIGGTPGSNGWLASQEWRECAGTFDPDGEKFQAYLNGEFKMPDAYRSYGAYCQGMIDKIDELCGKYDLDLAGDNVVIESVDHGLFGELTGLESGVQEDSALTLDFQGASVCECGDFNVSYNATLKGTETQPGMFFRLMYDYHNTAYLKINACIVIENMAEVQQWSYTRPDGITVLIVVEKEDDAHILYDRGDAMIYVNIRNIGWDWDYPSEVMTRGDLERIADSLDFSPKPGKIENFRQLRAEVEGLARERIDATTGPSPEEIQNWENHVNQGSFGALVREIHENEAYFTEGSTYFDNFWDTMEYAMADVTGDGEEDLILGKDGNVWEVWTMRDGITTAIAWGYETAILHEGNVMEITSITDGKPWHWYYQLDSNAPNQAVEKVEYRIGDETWCLITCDDAGNEKTEKISEERALEIIDSYKPLTLDWKSVQEFPMD